MPFSPDTRHKASRVQQQKRPLSPVEIACICKMPMTVPAASQSKRLLISLLKLENKSSSDYKSYPTALKIRRLRFCGTTFPPPDEQTCRKNTLEQQIFLFQNRKVLRTRLSLITDSFSAGNNGIVMPNHEYHQFPIVYSYGIDTKQPLSAFHFSDNVPVTDCNPSLTPWHKKNSTLFMPLGFSRPRSISLKSHC